MLEADGSTPAAWVAADLLSQAEHDEDAIPVLVTPDEGYAREVREELKLQVRTLPGRDIARASLPRAPNWRHAWRCTISFLISPIACAGLRPLGQVLEQFMMV